MYFAFPTFYSRATTAQCVDFVFVRNSTFHKYSETVEAPPSFIYCFIINVIFENILDVKSIV